MKTYTKYSGEGITTALESCVIVIEDTTEWVYLSMGIDQLIKEAEEGVAVFQPGNRLSPSLTGVTEEEAEKERIYFLADAKCKLAQLIKMREVLDHQNSLPLNELDMKKVENSRLWKKGKHL